MAQKKNEFDLYAFVAGAALEKDTPFQLECNCGGVVTIMPPLPDEYVVCSRCESKIKMLVIEGDPGYGCRLGEIQKANIGDVNFDRGTLRVVRKGGKTEYIPLNPEALACIEKK